MSEYRFSSALGYTFEQLAEMHNLSFSGYFMPANMTPAQVADFWRINQIDATRCVVMHDAEGAFVGMARMGTRGKRGWCGGFGIVPAFRGSGASRLLAEEMVRVAQTTGLSQLQLEVLTQNIRAHRLYERVGFVVQRRLFGLQLVSSALPTSASVVPAIERVPLETLLSWPHHNLAQPAWGLELASLLTMPCELLVASLDGTQNAFTAQRHGDTLRLQIVHLQHSLTDDALAALLRALASDAATIQIFNEPDDSPFLDRYRRLGFSEFFSQYEMLLKFQE
jgi:ribosomal protein S18 acetylase RimI-like enzyme